MPISQLTVLQLYGVLHDLIADVERLSESMAADCAYQTPVILQTALSSHSILLRSLTKEAEGAALEVVLRDAPNIKINPLTGEPS